MELFQLVVVGDAARRQVERSLERRHDPPATPRPSAPCRARARSSSAAVLRTLANRLEPSSS